MTNTTPLSLSFSDIRAADLPLVGGKGANLGELSHAGFPVPSGFCLTTVAFQKFIAACPDSDGLYALLDTVTTDNVETVRSVGHHVCEMLLDVPMPGIVADTVGSREEIYDDALGSSRRLKPKAELMRVIIFSAGLDEKCRCWTKNLLSSARKCCDSGEASSCR